MGIKYDFLVTLDEINGWDTAGGQMVFNEPTAKVLALMPPAGDVEGEAIAEPVMGLASALGAEPDGVDQRVDQVVAGDGDVGEAGDADEARDDVGDAAQPAGAIGEAELFERGARQPGERDAADGDRGDRGGDQAMGGERDAGQHGGDRGEERDLDRRAQRGPAGAGRAACDRLAERSKQAGERGGDREARREEAVVAAAAAGGGGEELVAGESISGSAPGPTAGRWVASASASAQSWASSAQPAPPRSAARASGRSGQRAVIDA